MSLFSENGRYFIWAPIRSDREGRGGPGTLCCQWVMMTMVWRVSGPGSGDTLLLSAPWSPPAMMTQCPGDSLTNDQLTPRTRDQNSRGELETDWGGGWCKFCCLEYLSRPMTRGIPFTSPNYLQRFQTVEGESSSSHLVFRSQRQERSEGQQWLSAHRGSPDNWNRLGIYSNDRWFIPISEQ